MPAKKEDLRRYIIMSKEGFLTDQLGAPRFKPSATTVAVEARAHAAIPAPEMRVLEALHENGPKLVEMAPEGELSLRLSTPGLKIVPEVFYHRQWQRFKIRQRPEPDKAPVPKKKPTAKAAGVDAPNVASTAASTTSFDVLVTDASTGNPIAGAQVLAFADFATFAGAVASTAADGRATLNDLAPSRALERVYVYPPAGWWGYFAAGTTGAQVSQIKLEPIDVKASFLLLPQLYGSLPATAGAGVTVAVIDTGIDGTHPDLPNVSGGLNCVGDEVRNNPAAAGKWGPALSEGEHGTHVAGIIGGRGTTSGFRGVAPSVTLRSYRVFPDDGSGASNFDIAKAIDAAVADKCDLINMSLGGSDKDDFTNAAIDRALAAGVVVIVAAGNDYRKPVAFPAAFPDSVAVSAMGRVGSFPKEALGSSDVASPKGVPSANDFLADFTNFGPEIDVTGPGVEIVSTLPGKGHGSMSGTSMACPAVTGFAAYLLAADPNLKQKSGMDRSRALKDSLYRACKPEGFGRDYEGFGLPLPSAVTS